MDLTWPESVEKKEKLQDFRQEREEDHDKLGKRRDTKGDPWYEEGTSCRMEMSTSHARKKNFYWGGGGGCLGGLGLVGGGGGVGGGGFVCALQYWNFRKAPNE